MHSMGEFITEQKFINYDLPTFEGMLPSIEDLHLEEVGQQGNLKQWRVKMAGGLNLPLGYLTARQIKKILILRFYRMEWERPISNREDGIITDYQARLEEEGWIRVGETEAWNYIMIEKITNAIKQDREYINEKITETLKPFIPLPLRGKLIGFSEWLGQLIITMLSEEAIDRDCEVDSGISEILKVLSGKEITSNNSLITFGEGNQFNKVSIGDVASGNIIKINITNIIHPTTT